MIIMRLSGLPTSSAVGDYVVRRPKATEDRSEFSLRSNLILLSGPSSAKPIN
jgi:hypothetical protein